MSKSDLSPNAQVALDLIKQLDVADEVRRELNERSQDFTLVQFNEVVRRMRETRREVEPIFQPPVHERLLRHLSMSTQPYLLLGLDDDLTSVDEP